MEKDILVICAAILIGSFGGIFAAFAIDIIGDSFRETKTRDRFFDLSFGFFLLMGASALFIGALSVVFCLL